MQVWMLAICWGLSVIDSFSAIVVLSIVVIIKWHKHGPMQIRGNTSVSAWICIRLCKCGMIGQNPSLKYMRVNHFLCNYTLWYNSKNEFKSTTPNNDRNTCTQAMRSNLVILTFAKKTQLIMGVKRHRVDIRNIPLNNTTFTLYVHIFRGSSTLHYSDFSCRQLDNFLQSSFLNLLKNLCTSGIHFLRIWETIIFSLPKNPVRAHARSCLKT